MSQTTHVPPVQSGQSSLSPVNWIAWGVASGLGLILFAACLLAGAPAEVVRAGSPRLRDASFSGTLWNGRAVLPQGGTVDWAVSPLQSIRTGTVAGDWSFEDAGSRLNGRMRFSGRAALTAISGVVSVADLSHLANADLGSCSLSARITSAQMVLEGDRLMLDGAATIGEGRCAGRDVPALTVVSASTDAASEMRVRAADTILSTVALGNRGGAVVTITPAGSRLFLGRVTTSETVLEIGPRRMQSNP